MGRVNLSNTNNLDLKNIKPRKSQISFLDKVINLIPNLMDKMGLVHHGTIDSIQQSPTKPNLKYSTVDYLKLLNNKGHSSKFTEIAKKYKGFCSQAQSEFNKYLSEASAA